jgi:DNA-binding transcriptional LysR family regulator
MPTKKATDTEKNIKSINLRDLECFITVVKEGNIITRAAAELGITQPCLSNQIIKLEEKLGGVTLIKKKKLTQAGKAFFDEAKAILSTLEQAAQRTKRIHQAESGYLTVGFTSSMANGVLPNILRTFKKEYPEIKLILSEEAGLDRISRLREQLVDIMFFYSEDRDFSEEKDLKIRRIGSESLVVILPENHPLATKSKITINDLRDEDLILPDSQFAAGLSKEIIDLYTEAKIQPKISLKAVFLVTILGLVSGELGISILPDSVKNLQRTGVVYREIAGQLNRKNQLSAVYRRGDFSIILKNFLDTIK